MKRIFALFVAALMTISCGVTALADDKGLADAITAAKKYVTIPIDQKDIDYNIYNNEKGNTIISISWSNEDGSTEVSLDKDGCLLDYNTYNNNDKPAKLASLSIEETKVYADDFLSAVYGANAAKFKLNKTQTSRYSHEFEYKIYINDIPVSNGNANISIDPDTGKIKNFSGIGKEFFNIKFPAPSGVIASSNAMKIIKDGSIEPYYRIYTDYNYISPRQSKQQIVKKAFLVFNSADTYSAVNAFTGEKINVDRYFNKYASKAEAEAAEDSAAGASFDNGFTAEELKAIDTAEGLISQEKAISIAKENFPMLKNVTFNSSNIMKDSYADVYYIRLGADEAYVSMNAKTGEIRNYNYYKKNYDENAVPYPEDKSKTVASDLVKRLSPIDSKKISDAKINSTYGGNTSISYTRLENGYKCDGQYINVNLDNKGNIVGYSNNFDNKITFPKPTKVMSESQAVKSLTDTFNFALSYSVDEDYKVTLCYCFEESGMVDASTGAHVDYKGEVITPEVESGIADIKGHWCEKYVSTLYNNGYKINDSSFKPDEPITFGELKEFFNDYSYEPYYAKVMMENGNNKNAEDDVIVTRYELADYILEYYNLEKVRDMGDIFVVTNYKDKIDNKYKPAVAIATELNILHGDEKDCFNGTKDVTRAEAAVALYNLLANEK